ncbi:DUF4124 domain-containing protein [Hydrogenophaga sp. OTU3427]|uniref:DUF4124 domain-containing protein n=1 Tax=Hydrogenophaga sp. OTU3427 TaxID=3043856 RepID=UPI00313D63A2
MKAGLLCFLCVALAGPPAWAVNKCTGSDGKVSFQDAPCAGKGGEIEVRPASGAAPVPPVPQAGDAPPVTEAQRLNKLTEESQKERRRRDLQGRLLPDARNALELHRQRCKQTQERLAAEQYRYVQNLYGKTHAAQIASEKAAAAALCDTRDRELKEQIDALAKECEALGCK